MTENGADFDVEQKKNQEFSFKLKAGVFLASVGGLSAVVGFGTALAASRRREAQGSAQGSAHGSARAALATAAPSDGALLALRALAWGTAYAVGGVGLLCFGVWKLSGANDLKEFRSTMGSVLPRIPKKESSGRTEFEGLTDLLKYIISESENKKSKE
ncbi:Transmembrane protein 242-like Protein [Gryllus bimaculatus]|nr:Transmembrane protein 242-like Protein [Gryllus bimaculatus]